MKLIECACQFCGVSASKPWGSEAGFVAVKCLNCDFVYVNPRPADSDISDGNKIGEHRTLDGSLLDVSAGRSPAKTARYRDVVGRLMSDRLHEPVDWLDVGAGYGETVAAVKGLFPQGSLVTGVEPMDRKASVARGNGLDVVTGLLADLEPDRQFDVISAINVLSHLPDIRGFLREISGRLKPNGLVLIETGNGADLASRRQYPDTLFLPDHLVFAGKRHVAGFLADTGFTLVRSAEYPIHPPGIRGLVYWAKQIAKAVSGRHGNFRSPFGSPFRSVLYLAARNPV
ncbi:MAG: class I SAM-dependent methyltransferase [Bauldia sp.]